MRKINKKTTLATEYFEWQKDKKNPKVINYDSSKGKYYDCVYYSLIYLQRGCCAYTEKLILVNEKVLEELPQNFKNGKYDGEKDSYKFGHIEHFDSEDKKRYGWNWENLFIVDVRVNILIKSRIEPKLLKDGLKINPKLKPDNKDYSPFNFLDYNCKSHCFIPKVDIEEESELDTDIKNMLWVLGINNINIIRERRNTLNSFCKEGKPLSVVKEYFTAYKMLLDNSNMLFCKDL